MRSGAFKGTSLDLLYKGRGLESLAQRRRSQKLFFFHKILNGLATSHFQSYLDNYTEFFYQTRSSGQNKYKLISTRTKIFESSLYPYCPKEWNNSSEEIRKIVNQ